MLEPVTSRCDLVRWQTSEKCVALEGSHSLSLLRYLV